MSSAPRKLDAALTVVGDDAQSIYSFRAATVRNILDFPKQFTPPARIITLDRNYRSTQPILPAANAVIDLAVERHKKNLRSERPSAEQPQLVSVRDETDQARYVVDRVLEYRESGVLLRRQAVLFRASHHSGPLEIELALRNIPFVKYGGLKFLEAAHINLNFKSRWIGEVFLINRPEGRAARLPKIVNERGEPFGRMGIARMTNPFSMACSPKAV